MRSTPFFDKFEAVGLHRFGKYDAGQHMEILWKLMRSKIARRVGIQFHSGHQSKLLDPNVIGMSPT